MERRMLPNIELPCPLMLQLSYSDFEIGECIGAGTVGTVYRVEDKSGREYALKLLARAVSDDKLIVSRFEREVLILSKLDHPNIIKYHGQGQHEGQLFYVMELMHGGTLKEVLRRSGSLTWQEAAEIGRQIASALQHAHNHGIIHRDLKPGNVYLNDLGQLKLGDFGIARDIKSVDLTEQGLTVGTYAYMCPELVRGKRQITGKVDVYALGCLLYELIVGRTPYTGDNFAEIFEQHLHSPPPRVSDLGLPCPGSLDELIVALLAKDPEDRPFNARNVQGMLNEMLDVANAVIAEPGDRGAGTIRPVQASLAARVQAQSERHITWKRLAIASMAVVAIVAALALFMRDG